MSVASFRKRHSISSAHNKSVVRALQLTKKRRGKVVQLMQRARVTPFPVRQIICRCATLVIDWIFLVASDCEISRSDGEECGGCDSEKLCDNSISRLSFNPLCVVRLNFFPPSP